LLATWLVLAVAMPLNGIFRELALKRILAASLADVVSAALGALVVLGITRALFRVPADTPTRSLVLMSATLVVLTVAFECAVGLVEGRSWPEIAANYAIWRGRLWPLVLAVLAATPFLWRGRG
jgi:hypothetical protein